MNRFSSYLALLSCATAFGSDVTESVKSGDFWSKPSEEVIIGSHFTRPDSEHVRLSNCTLGDLTTGEVVITLEDDKPVSMQAMLYNKGDDGLISEDDFHARVEEARATMDSLTGTRARLRATGKRDSAVKLKSWEWKWDNGVARLDANFTGKNKKFAPEFIRLNLGRDAKALNSGGASDNISRHELRESITTEEDGTTWLKGIPMIDQGQKGYCVPATLARVFAFYGMDKVDQHTLADLCDSAGDGGTSTLAMEQSMKKICKKHHIKFIVLEDYVSSVKSLVPAYNKLAKREDKPLLNYMKADPFSMADASILREARAGKASQVSRWMKDIKKHIDSGSPVIWNVTVGIYKEEIPLPQERGGHLRLIIGYNLKEKTIIYTDSWGAMHARKTMPAADALSMTQGRYVMRLK